MPNRRRQADADPDGTEQPVDMGDDVVDADFEEVDDDDDDDSRQDQTA